MKKWKSELDKKVYKSLLKKKIKERERFEGGNKISYGQCAYKTTIEDAVGKVNR